jgi:hypothetical protein
MDYPFDSIGLDDEVIENFTETYKTLKNKFGIESTGYINFNLEDFESFKHCQSVTIRGSYVIKKAGNDCYIFFLDVRYGSVGERGNYGLYNDCQTWALAYLKKNFGRVLIRPETLTDKILELIHPIELDFADDKAFSNTFYVLVNDRQKAEVAIDSNFRKVVMDVRERDFVIEIINHTLIIGNRKSVSPENAEYLAEFVARIASNC